MAFQEIILAIEDNPDDIFLLKEGFRYLDIKQKLKIFENGKSALMFLKETNTYPPVLLLDLNLPDMDGREVLVELKKDPDLRRIPVVIFSTSNSPQDVEFCMMNHANSYVTKPLEFNELVETLRTLLTYWLEINYHLGL